MLTLLEDGLKSLSSTIRRSHTSILSWFRSLSFLFVDRSLRGKVELLINDTKVEVGGREVVLFIAFEPNLRRIVYMRIFEATNILTALTFMKKRIKAIYRFRMKVLTGGAQCYRAACKFLNLDHYVYDSRLRNLMERVVQYVEDRTEDFDDYIPCRRERCDKVHAQMLLSSMGFMINEVFLSEYFDLKAFLEKTISAIEVIKNA